MELAEPSSRPALHHQLRGPAGVQEGVVVEYSVFRGDHQAVQGLLKQATGLEVTRGLGFAAGAPALSAPFTAHHPCQQLPAGPVVGRVEHGPDLEGPEAIGTALEVALCGGKQFSQQVVAQMAVVGQQGIGQRDAAFRGGHQGKAAGLLQAGRHQGPAQTALGHLLGGQAAWFDRIGQMTGEVVVAHQAGHLFNQIHLAVQVDRPGGRYAHVPALVVLLQLAADGLQGAHDALIAEITRFAVLQHRPQQVVQGVAAQMEGRGGLLRAALHPAAHHLSTAQLLQQGHRPIRSGQRGFRWQSLLEAAAGFRAKTHAAGRAAHGHARKNRGFQPDRSGAVGDGLLGSPHHAGQGDRLVGVGHHEGVAAEIALLAVEGGEGFAIATVAQPHPLGLGLAALQGCQPFTVEGMQRLARFQHHQIGDVDNVVDRPNARLFQTLLNPPGRGGHSDIPQFGDAEGPSLVHPGLGLHIGGQVGRTTGLGA